MKFAALDFETADNGRDSACALAVVRVEDGKVTATGYKLIRPPRSFFLFTYVHGITWKDVADQPGFGRVWEELAPLVEGVDFLAAHNASFDRGVLAACCEGTGHKMPAAPFLCTVKLARRLWDLRPTNLPAVCRHLGLPLKHHEALSDAMACARIVIAAREDGAELPHHDLLGAPAKRPARRPLAAEF